MTDVKRVGSSGIHTVEGNVAGPRAAKLTKARDEEQAKYEAAKSQIKEQNTAVIGRIDDKFNSASDVADQEFRKRTVGLVTADEFRQARLTANAANAVTQKTEMEREQERIQSELEKKKVRAEKRKKMASALSFDVEDEDCPPAAPIKTMNQTATSAAATAADLDAEGVTSASTTQTNEQEGGALLKKRMKNPEVDTSFLPDRERDENIEREKARLRQEWLDQQEIIKNESLNVVYSYWNGSGHRKSITIKKDTSIGKFLEAVKQQCMAEFTELRMMSADSLIYVKEDLIIPQHVTFYDLIITKARGKSGPLFHFDVHDDIRMQNDARIEKDESHPGKVVERRWYEKNKHIFPASRWEIFDPNVSREKYTIHGDEINHHKK